VDWVIVGAMTGPGSSKRQPDPRWVQAIVELCHSAGVPVFMKSNLAGVWGLGADLIQQYPAGMLEWTAKGAKHG